MGTDRSMTSNVCLTMEGTGEGLSERLGAALDALQPASLIIRPAQGGTLMAASLRPLVALAQSKGTAALVAGDAALAKAVAADGVHLQPSPDLLDDYAAARRLLGTGMIVGADAGRSRHDAMCLGEAGADYVAFGATAAPGAEDTQHDLCVWWADLFEVPVVALGMTGLDDARALLSSGADFVAFDIPGGRSAADIRDWARTIASTVAPVQS